MSTASKQALKRKQFSSSFLPASAFIIHRSPTFRSHRSARIRNRNRKNIALISSDTLLVFLKNSHLFNHRGLCCSKAPLRLTDPWSVVNWEPLKLKLLFEIVFSLQQCLPANVTTTVFTGTCLNMSQSVHSHSSTTLGGEYISYVWALVFHFS